MASSKIPPTSEKCSSESDSDEEAFEDAVDSPKVGSVDLSLAISDAKVALNLFLNNRFEEAISRMQPWSDNSMYHSLAHTTLLFLQAMLSFEKTDIDTAIRSVKKTISIAHSLRHKESLLSSLQSLTLSNDYTSYSHIEVHAELIYAESLLLRALLSFVQDENLVSFIKGALKIKTCHKSYKECQKISAMKDRMTLTDYDHFSSGVNMGIGAFNLMISQLPSKVLKLLEFVGFSGNRSVGMKELTEGSKKMASLRGPLCSLILLAYHTIIVYILGTGEADIDFAEEILRPCMSEFPKSALFLFFAGRIEEIKGNIDVGIKLLSESIESQSEWKQLHHICYWELMWSYAYKSDWLFAMKFAEKLANENRWSKAIYTYLKASFLLLCDKTEKAGQLVQDLYRKIPQLVQRFAGKSLPIEKFALKKVKLYEAQDGQLTLPALEMILVWNGFNIIGKKPELLEKFMVLIEDSLQSIVALKKSMKYYQDNYSLALLLKGVCLGFRGQLFQADMCFQEIIDNGSSLKHDVYLVPWAITEQALLRIKMERYDEALSLLENAKNKYKGYGLDFRLHFKIHAAHLMINLARKGKTTNGA